MINLCVALTGSQVFIITGGNSGVGFELAKILYGANAKVYLAGRSEKRVLEAIRLLRAGFPSSRGDLVWLPLDLADLTSVKIAVEEYESKEKRLDVLWNNAGVMCTPTTAKSEQVTFFILRATTLAYLKFKLTIEYFSRQGYDLQIGTNVLGPYLFTALLYPIMRKTAETAPINSVRVCWASSITIELSPRGGIEIDDSGSLILPKSKYIIYSVSKVANNMLASEFGKKCRQENILSVVSNIHSTTTLAIIPSSRT
jgi:NAD(P)-dependent dehydrogenase (short-subunit alcohol dehydrogenase family)